MPTNESDLEKRIAAQFPDLDLESPPAPPQELFDPDHYPEPDAIHAELPITRLLLEGVAHGSISVDFLLGVHDLANDHRLHLDGISVGRFVPAEDRQFT